MSDGSFSLARNHGCHSKHSVTVVTFYRQIFNSSGQNVTTVIVREDTESNPPFSIFHLLAA